MESNHADLDPQGGGRSRHVFRHRRGRRIIGVDQQSDPPGGGDNLVQQSQLLYRNLGEGKVDAGRVAARPGEADEA
jgi:hypothetical protein